MCHTNTTERHNSICYQYNSAKLCSFQIKGKEIIHNAFENNIWVSWMFPLYSGSSLGTFSSRNRSVCHRFAVTCKQTTELPAGSSKQEKQCIKKITDGRKIIHFPAERRVTLIQSYTFETFINNSLEADLLCPCLCRDRIKETHSHSECFSS